MEPKNGELILRDQLKDYSERGKELEDCSFLDFCLDTYLEKSHVENPRNPRVFYVEGSDQENKARIMCSPNHETMPNFIRRWFPRSNNTWERTIYCTSMMALLRPWWKLLDLQEESFKVLFQCWKDNTSKRNLDIMENIQFYHKASQGAKKPKNKTAHSPVSKDAEMMNDDLYGEDHTTTHKQYIPLTEDDIQIARDNSIPQRDVNHSRLALSIAFNCGVFGDLENKGGGKSAKIPNSTNLLQYAEWNSQIQKHVKKDMFQNLVMDNSVSIHPPVVTVHAPELPDVIPLGGEAVQATNTDVALNKEQK